MLLAVAHGSADPAAARTIAALMARVRELAPDLEVGHAFIQHGVPALAGEAARLGGPGTDLVLVPLLLATGYHLTTDIAVTAASAGARVAAPLGPDELLCEALTDRLTEARVGRSLPAPPGAGLGVVLAAAGSSDARARASVAEQAALLSRHLGVAVLAAFAAAGAPTVRQAVTGMRASTGGPVAVASYLLAPGRFRGELALSGADLVTAPLGDHPAIARLVLRRYRQAQQRQPERAAQSRPARR